MKLLRVVLAAPRAADAGAADRVEADTRPARPALNPEGPGPGATAVVIDVLRATTTLSAAFANGARRLVAAATVEEAREWHRRDPTTLLCGERDGRVLPGFDLGNSPLEYASERVAGRTLVFASTNGSQALRLVRTAKRRVLGAFVNAAAVVERVCRESEVWLIASGKLGSPALEDLACAGWIARALGERGFEVGSPEARLVRSLAPSDAAAVCALVQGCSHARTLRALGPAGARDVEFCSTLDTIASAAQV